MLVVVVVAVVVVVEVVVVVIVVTGLHFQSPIYLHTGVIHKRYFTPKL